MNSADCRLIVAAGPSLRRSDLDKLRGFCKTIVVNCAVFYAPWADILFAGDNSWFTYYGPKTRWFKGQRISVTGRGPDITKWRNTGWARTGGNSGHQAIQYAADDGGKHLLLYAFDHQKTGGKAHCHPDHPHRPKVVVNIRGKAIERSVNLGNANGIQNWPSAMNKTAVDLAKLGVKVTNLSRETALTCFERMTVEEFMEQP